MEKETASQKSLEVLRREIDELDRQLFSLLARRMAVVRDIGGMKRSQGLPISDPVREALLKVPEFHLIISEEVLFLYRLPSATLYLSLTLIEPAKTSDQLVSDMGVSRLTQAVSGGLPANLL